MNRLRKVISSNRNLSYILFSLLLSLLFHVGSSYSPFKLSGPMVPSSTDNFVYTTVGQGWLHGSLPYRDLWDHKGPLVYLIHAISILMFNSLIGVWILNIVILTITIYFLQKVSLQLCEDNFLFSLISPVLLITLICLKGKTYMNFSPESIALPFITISIYLFIHNYINSVEKEFSWKQCLFLGFTVGIVFLSKVNNVSYIIGFYLIYFINEIAIRKNFKTSMRFVFLLLVGFSMIMLPFIAYFAYHKSLYDFIFANYIFNLGYADASNWITRLKSINRIFSQMLSPYLYIFKNWEITSSILRFNIMVSLFSLSYFYKKKKIIVISFVTYLFFSILIVMYPGRGYEQYSYILVLPLALFTSHGFFLIYKNQKKKDIIYLSLIMIVSFYPKKMILIILITLFVTFILLYNKGKIRSIEDVFFKNYKKFLLAMMIFMLAVSSMQSAVRVLKGPDRKISEELSELIVFLNSYESETTFLPISTWKSNFHMMFVNELNLIPETKIIHGELLSSTKSASSSFNELLQIMINNNTNIVTFSQDFLETDIENAQLLYEFIQSNYNQVYNKGQYYVFEKKLYNE